MRTTKQAGDWFVDRSPYGGNKRYMLAWVGMPKVMALVSEDGLLWHDGAAVEDVRNVGASEWDKITNGAGGDFERVPGHVEIKSPSVDGPLVDGGRLAALA